MPRIPALLATAALSGAAVGCTEALARILLAPTPSVLRRAPGLVLTAGVLYAALGVAAGLILSSLWAIARRRPSDPRMALDALIPAALAPAVLLLAGDGFIRRFIPGDPRWLSMALLAGLILAGATLAWWVYRRSCRRAEQVRSFSMRLHFLRLLICGAGAAGLVVSGGLGLAAGGPFGLSLTTPPPPVTGGATGRPNILLILVDTLRADHLEAYGSGRAPTGATSGLAARGALFENAYAPSSWTMPSVASLLTSRHPAEHGVRRFTSEAPDHLPKIQEALSRIGYRTAALVGNPLLGHEAGFDRGWGLYDSYSGQVERSLAASMLANRLLRRWIRVPHPETFRLYPRLGLAYPRRVRLDLSDYVRGDEITDLALDLIDGFPDDPFFVYLHYGEPHTPYLLHPFGLLPRAERLLRDRVDQVIESYNGEVAYLDRQVGRLLEGLEERDLTGNTVIVFLSDHGEEFLEHGVWEHGSNLHEKSLRIPLILAGPGVPVGLRITEPVDLLDVAPTILSLISAPPEPAFRGRNLFELAPGASWPLLSRIEEPRMSPARQLSVLADGWRYIRHGERGGGEAREELFLREQDPGETEDLSSGSPERLARMRDLAEMLESSMAPTATPDRESHELNERLRSLGYID